MNSDAQVNGRGDGGVEIDAKASVEEKAQRRAEELDLKRCSGQND